MLPATSKTQKIVSATLATLLFVGAATSADEKRLSIYSSVATYTLPVTDRQGHEYVSLLEVLEPLGRVSARVEGQRWKLRFNNTDSDFIAGKTRIKIRGRDFTLTAPFVIENSRGLVPVNSLSALLPAFLGNSVNFHEAARRLFIGDVATQVTAQLDSSTPPRLVLNFTAPVNPTISTEPGKLRMVFKRDPVVSPGSESISFDNQVITHATYSENNGDAELDLAANEPLLATFSNNRKTIIVSAVPQTPATPNVVGTGPQNPAQAPPQSAPGANIASGNANTNINVHRILAVVDPAHGGEERGAALTDKLAEKDVTLGFARLLRHELEMRGFAVALLRDGDTTSTLDQRAAAANVARAGIYISLHAVAQGSGARVYTALLPVEGTSKGIFHAWNAAQAPSLPVSRIVSAAIVGEMQRKEFPVQVSSASLRPLSNVFMPAVAVELAPGANGVADLTSANYQQRVASAIANAVASVRDRLGVQQ